MRAKYVILIALVLIVIIGVVCTTVSNRVEMGKMKNCNIVFIYDDINVNEEVSSTDFELIIGLFNNKKLFRDMSMNNTQSE